MNVPRASGEIKAPTYSRTRSTALSLLARTGLSADERHDLWSIAFSSAPLTAADAWAVNRIAERTGRTS